MSSAPAAGSNPPTSIQLFGKMEVESQHMKAQSSGMSGMIEGDEDLMSKAWSTTPLPACQVCKTYQNVLPVFRGNPGTKLQELIQKTGLVRHVPTAKPNEIGWCETCEALVPAVGDLRPMFTQTKHKHLSYQPMAPERARAQVQKASAAVSQFLADLKREEQHTKEVGQPPSQPTVINMKLLQ